VWRLTARNGVRLAAHRTRRRFSDDEQRATLDDQFAMRTADDVARELGNMKGALMKAGQLLSFVVEALPESAQQALSSLYSDAPPMSSELAAGVVRDEFGKRPSESSWTGSPCRRRGERRSGAPRRDATRPGRRGEGAVPGRRRRDRSGPGERRGLYRLFSAMAMKGLDTKALVNELRSRMREELDYRIEASNVTEFRAHFEGHPFVSMPALVPEHSDGAC
jgi:predicted unusual protein kinase regulating ubiquinone biosynthesis (AarF/ABC1/UbiB family)